MGNGNEIIAFALGLPVWVKAAYCVVCFALGLAFGWDSDEGKVNVARTVGQTSFCTCAFLFVMPFIAIGVVAQAIVEVWKWVEKRVKERKTRDGLSAS